MSEYAVTRAVLFIVLFFASIRCGISLQCYQCTSTEDAACSSSLNGMKATTCTWDDTDPATVTSTDSTMVTASDTADMTSISDVSGATSDTTILSTTADPTTLPAETTVTEATTTADPTAVDSDATTVSNDDAIVADVIPVRVARSTRNKSIRIDSVDEDYVCYTLVLTVDSTTVTDRGCHRSSATCSTLNTDKYPSNNYTTCTMCREDGCNSSPISLAGLTSMALPFITIVLLSR